MRDNTIFQFVGFETTVSLDGFLFHWENFAKKVFKKDIHTVALQQQVVTHNRYKFISRNEWPQENFSFAFMEGRHSDRFPDHKVKVVESGGYSALQLDCENAPGDDEVRVIAFIHEESVDLDACRSVPHLHLNIYEAYYQSCLYEYILEYFVQENQALELVTQLKKQIRNLDIGMYKECLVLEG